MKKYLIRVVEDVADEGDVGIVQVLTEDELKAVSTVDVGFGDLYRKQIHYDISDAKEITDDEIKVLEKFGLKNLQFGGCHLNMDFSKNDVFLEGGIIKTTNKWGYIVYKNEKREKHRLDGPAVITSFSTEWYKNGKLHREYGPAFEYKDGTAFYYLEGIRHTKDEYENKLKELGKIL